jgi:hypothetical protein
MISMIVLCISGCRATAALACISQMATSLGGNCARSPSENCPLPFPPYVVRNHPFFFPRRCPSASTSSRVWGGTALFTCCCSTVGTIRSGRALFLGDNLVEDSGAGSGVTLLISIFVSLALKPALDFLCALCPTHDTSIKVAAPYPRTPTTQPSPPYLAGPTIPRAERVQIHRQ